MSRCILIQAEALLTTAAQLADLANLTQPWTVTPLLAKAHGEGVIPGFKDASWIPAPLEVIEKEYCRLTDWPYPIQEMVFARSWMLFRVRPTPVHGRV